VAVLGRRNAFVAQQRQHAVFLLEVPQTVEDPRPLLEDLATVALLELLPGHFAVLIGPQEVAGWPGIAQPHVDLLLAHGARPLAHDQHAQAVPVGTLLGLVDAGVSDHALSQCVSYSAPMLDNDDSAFIDAFETGTLPNSAFHHRDHVRLAWLYLRRDGPETGAREVVDGIRQFAAAHGAADRFHETLTRFWVHLVQHLVEVFPAVDRFDALLAIYPRLADKTLVYRHYRPETLASQAARVGWMVPDLLPLP